MSLRSSQAVSRLVTLTLLAAGLAFGSGSAAWAAGVPEGKVYSDHVQCNEAEDCKIDLHLTRGYRAFAQCQVCHGLTGEGSTIAPSLIEKLKEIDQDRFNEVVINGYTGQIGVMPGWKDNPNVINHIEALYIYLMARSDGVLPGGRLERFDR